MRLELMNLLHLLRLWYRTYRFQVLESEFASLLENQCALPNLFGLIASAKKNRAKRRYARSRSEVDKILFLQERSRFYKVERNAKFRYQNTEKLKLSDLSQNSPSKFWSYINKFHKENSESGVQVHPNDFVKHFSNTSYFTSLVDPDFTLNVVHSTRD